jgi:type IV secretory pathway component VirB8
MFGYRFGLEQLRMMKEINQISEESIKEAHSLNDSSSKRLDGVRVTSTLWSVIIFFVLFIVVLIAGAIVWAMR